MEPTTPAPNPASASHEPRIATPIMDVVAPPSQNGQAANPARPNPEKPIPGNLQVATEPQTTDDLSASEGHESKSAAAPEAHTTVPASRTNSVAVPITITVIIVIVLSALAIFAYLQSH